MQEGEPNDPQLKRLQREIDEVNRLFDEWERRAAMEEERRNAAKLFNDRCNSLEVSLSEFEKQIIKVSEFNANFDCKMAFGDFVSQWCFILL